jgi:hypothetical protein
MLVELLAGDAGLDDAVEVLGVVPLDIRLSLPWTTKPHKAL